MNHATRPVLDVPLRDAPVPTCPPVRGVVTRRRCAIGRSLAAVIAFCLTPAVATPWSTPAGAADTDDQAVFELSDDVKDAIYPLFHAIADASVSRTTVELTSETLAGAEVIDSQSSTYQIASQKPDQFTIYFKEAAQRTRIYVDGRRTVIAMSPTAYIELPQPIGIAAAVDDLPVPMGPFPEPVMALSLAGYDPAISLIGGMKSLEVVDRAPFRGGKPAIRLRGVQDDGVSWDLWVSEDADRRPLRMIADLTDMLKASNDVRMPPGVRYRLRFDFLSWRMTGQVESSLFQFEPAAQAQRYQSVAAYFESIQNLGNQHPLLGKPVPRFAGVTSEGNAITPESFQDKVVVLSFWSSWCKPCVAGLPITAQTTQRYQDKGVVFYSINVGEPVETLQGFLSQQSWKFPVVMDPQAEIAGAFAADAIPQRIVIGKTGMIEAAHVGYQDDDALAKQLTTELDVLSIGGRIATSQPR